MRSLRLVLVTSLALSVLAGCDSSPAQQQANLDTKVLATQIAETLKADPMLPLDSKTKDQAQKIADAVAAAIDAKGKITPETVTSAVVQSGVVPPQYLGYGALGLLLVRIVQAQLNAKKSSS